MYIVDVAVIELAEMETYSFRAVIVWAMRTCMLASAAVERAVLAGFLLATGNTLFHDVGVVVTMSPEGYS